MVILRGSGHWYTQCVTAWHRLEARLSDQRLRGTLFLSLRQDLQNSRFIGPEGNVFLGVQDVAVLQTAADRRIYYYLSPSGTDPNRRLALYRREGVLAQPVELIRDVVTADPRYDCWDVDQGRLLRGLRSRQIRNWHQVVAFHLSLDLQQDYRDGQYSPQNPSLRVLSWARRV